jgi:hypothetical protein
MPFKNPPAEVMDQIANEILAALKQIPGNPLAKPRGMTFMDIERTASAIGKRVSTRLTEESLAEHAADQPDEADCPQCQQSCRVTRKKRIVTTPDGPVEYLEPASHCVECRRDFFPDAPGIAFG